MPNIRRAITIYTRWTNPISGLTKPFRRVLSNCFISDQENTIAERTGIVLSQSTFLQVFLQPDLIYIPFSEWQELAEDELDGKWSVELGTINSFIVDFVTDYDFNFASNATTTQLESAFINANRPNAKRIASIETNLRGSKLAQHISLRC